jgi:hypothetical protein
MMWASIAAVVVIVFLALNLRNRFGSDRISQFNERRRATSQLVDRGELVDGNRRLTVALAVTPSTFFYENADMQASLDLPWVREVEYDNELATGGVVAGGKVLRLRSNSQTFEFVLPEETVSRWQTILPPRREASAGRDPLAATLQPQGAIGV